MGGEYKKISPFPTLAGKRCPFPPSSFSPGLFCLSCSPSPSLSVGAIHRNWTLPLPPPPLFLPPGCFRSDPPLLFSSPSFPHLVVGCHVLTPRLPPSSSTLGTWVGWLGGAAKAITAFAEEEERRGDFSCPPLFWGEEGAEGKLFPSSSSSAKPTYLRLRLCFFPPPPFLYPFSCSLSPSSPRAGDH